MLSGVLIWFYMMGTVFLLGYGILTGLSSCCHYRVKSWDGYFFCGLAGATVYAQFFSIFAPVGLAANLILTGLCLAAAFFCRKRLREDFGRLYGKWQEKRKPGGKVPAKAVLLPAVVIFLFLLYAYGTSRGILHYDTALYHAQSIRWIEEYGIVKGLGNLHCRLAYNSASFALSALYSMRFLGGQSYHCAAGFFALILAFVCLKAVGTVRRKGLRPSDFARAACVYYLLIIFDEMISPASDYFMVLTAFYLVIRWMDFTDGSALSDTECFAVGLACLSFYGNRPVSYGLEDSGGNCGLRCEGNTGLGQRLQRCDEIRYAGVGMAPRVVSGTGRHGQNFGSGGVSVRRRISDSANPVGSADEGQRGEINGKRGWKPYFSGRRFQIK